MTEPTVICSKCKTEINFTESFAAPLIASIRRDYEQRLSHKDAEIAKRETSLREREEALSKARGTIDNQVTEKLKQKSVKIGAEETGKAKLALGTDREQKAREITELQDV